MTTSASALDLLTLLRLPGIGPKGAIRMLEQDSASALESEGFNRARGQVLALAAECATLGIGIAGWFDPSFPQRLKGIPDAPAVLFYRGDLAVVSRERSVAIVGTREPTTWGKHASRIITDRFAADDWIVVSGLALGVDTIAHERALAAGTPTVAVLGNGLSTVYPKANRALAERILDAGGLQLAEVQPHARAEARSLVKRDRLQSGLAALTVVCQGSRTSGAMHTARYAVEQSRPLYCAALARGDESVETQDEGIATLLSEPANRLPELLPPWRHATRRATSGSAPVALPLDESSLASLDSLAPPRTGENSHPALF